MFQYQLELVRWAMPTLLGFLLLLDGVVLTNTALWGAVVHSEDQASLVAFLKDVQNMDVLEQLCNLQDRIKIDLIIYFIEAFKTNTHF